MLSSSDHYALADSDAETFWFVGTLAMIKAGAEQTGGVLSVVEFTHAPGFATPPHVHHESDEAFYILEGKMRGFCGAHSWQAGPGSFIWLPRGIPHGYAVDGETLLRSLAITLPAGFERFIREVGEPARERTLPAPAPLDVTKLVTAGARVGIVHLGPPEK